MTIHRRQLLRGLGALGGLTVCCGGAGALARDRADRRPTLVLLELAGGNDGLSTVVPYADDAYGRARRATRVEEGRVLPLDEYRGLHPALGRLRTCWERGQMAIVEGAGYPDPNRSHFKSFDIWHTADARGRASGEGWVSRLGQALFGDASDPNHFVHVGSSVPYSLHSTEHPAASFVLPSGYRWVANEGDVDAVSGDAEMEGGQGGSTLDALRGVMRDAQASSREIRRAAARYRPRVEYPDDELGYALRVAAAVIDGDIGARLVSVQLGGFDTHNDQRPRHDALMASLDGALGAFLDDLRGTESGRRTVVMAFSEFGRRVAENGSRGTDHGCAGPMFLFGEGVRGGLYGEHPSLTELDEGDLVHTVDFRSVYGSVIESWYGVPHEKVLGARYPLLPLFPA